MIILGPNAKHVQQIPRIHYGKTTCVIFPLRPDHFVIRILKLLNVEQEIRNSVFAVGDCVLKS